MKRISLITVLFFTGWLTSFAQYNSPEDFTWAFGTRAGLHFSGGTPSPITTSISTSEGSCSVSDASGNLLFYSDGTKVWNRSGAVMPSGSAVASFATASCTQAALAIPVIGSTTQYYLFSLEEATGGTSGACHMVYCIVDMTLASGFGDVVSASIGTPVTSLLGEKMTAVKGDACNIWLLTHRKDSTRFLAYSVSASGIAAPVVSAVGTFTVVGTYGQYALGELKVSPDRRRVIEGTSVNTGGSTGCEVYDFDPATGIVSNAIVIDSINWQYNVEFSPNSQVIYTRNNSTIYQYDLTAGSAAAIRASQFSVGSGYSLKLGPDNKIYFCQTTTTIMGTINNPNTLGSGCGYTTGAVTLSGGTSAFIGFSNIYIASPGTGGGGGTIHKLDTTVCLAAGPYILRADTLGSTYVWSTGDTTSSKSITAPGTYWVQINNGCRLNVDTFVIHAPTTSVVDTVQCATVKVSTPTTGASAYVWTFGDGSGAGTASAMHTYSVAGTYNVVLHVTDATGCTVADSVTVTVHVPPIVNLGPDTVICGNSYPLSSSVTYPGTETYAWSTGATTSSITATTSGVYTLTVYLDGCQATDAVNVLLFDISTVDLGPDTTVCMNLNLDATLKVPGTHYLWQDGYNGSTYGVSHSGTYYVTVTNRECMVSDTIRVKFQHLFQNIPDTFVCKGVEFAIPLTATIPPGGSILWEDGSTFPTRIVRDSGTYWVYIKQNECEILDTIHVVTGHCDCWHDVANVFTPNGDGLNDVVHPRIQPGCPVSGYLFSIYNRWGEMVFTSDVPGKRWDGAYNGQPADLGVYYYTLQFYVGIYNKKVTRNGDLTLIR